MTTASISKIAHSPIHAASPLDPAAAPPVVVCVAQELFNSYVRMSQSGTMPEGAADAFQSAAELLETYFDAGTEALVFVRESQEAAKEAHENALLHMETSQPEDPLEHALAAFENFVTLRSILLHGGDGGFSGEHIGFDDSFPMTGCPECIDNPCCDADGSADYRVDSPEGCEPSPCCEPAEKEPAEPFDLSKCKSDEERVRVIGQTVRKFVQDKFGDHCRMVGMTCESRQVIPKHKVDEMVRDLTHAITNGTEPESESGKAILREAKSIAAITPGNPSVGSVIRGAMAKFGIELPGDTFEKGGEPS